MNAYKLRKVSDECWMVTHLSHILGYGSSPEDALDTLQKDVAAFVTSNDRIADIITEEAG